MREIAALVLGIAGFAVAFDACMQAEFSGIWVEDFVKQGVIGAALAVAGLLLSGCLFERSEEKKKAAPDGNQDSGTNT